MTADIYCIIRSKRRACHLSALLVGHEHVSQEDGHGDRSSHRGHVTGQTTTEEEINQIKFNQIE
jgi:hypothetical protein